MDGGLCLVNFFCAAVVFLIWICGAFVLVTEDPGDEEALRVALFFFALGGLFFLPCLGFNIYVCTWDWWEKRKEEKERKRHEAEIEMARNQQEGIVIM